MDGCTAGCLQIERYRLSLDVQDRYVRTEVAVSVRNTGNVTEKYEFGVNLNKHQFISSLVMKVGEKGLE